MTNFKKIMSEQIIMKVVHGSHQINRGSAPWVPRRTFLIQFAHLGKAPPLLRILRVYAEGQRSIRMRNLDAPNI